MTQTYKLEIEPFHRNGGTFWLEIMAKLAEEDGILKIIGVVRDISKMKVSELERERLITKLRKALMEKEKLLKMNNGVPGIKDRKISEKVLLNRNRSSWLVR